MIYLDNAATSFMKPPQVARAVYDSFSRIGNAGRGAHEPTLNASRLIYGTRVKLARLFNAPDPSRIAFTLNVTEALNIAVSGLVQIKAGRPVPHVISSVTDHNSVLRPVFRKEDEGAHLTLLGADRLGRISLEELEKVMRENATANDGFSENERTAGEKEGLNKQAKASVDGHSDPHYPPQIVVLGHASNLTGNVIDIKKAAQIVHSFGGILVVDAAQSAGEIPVDVQDMDIDVLCFTGHKALFGPQGTGGIYVRDGLEIPAFKVGGSGVQSFDRHQPAQMPTVLEAGTINGHGLAGLLAGVDFILETGVENIHNKSCGLAAAFADGVEGIPGVTVYGDIHAPLRAPIISINIGDMDSGQVSDILWEEYEICTRAGGHCAPLMHKALGTAEQGAVRFSFSWFNTIEEVRAAVRAVREIAG